MSSILLTQSSTFIIGPVSQVLGWIMNLIFAFLDSVFSIQNIGLCIILFTIIMYFLMLPLTIKQQKFSKLSAKMNPEIQAVQKKYKDKKDQTSMMKMNEETKLIYEKYGTSPTGSCLQLLIQMPILFALYRVIYNIPAYVSSVKETFMPVVEGIINTNGYQDTLSNFMENISLKTVALNFDSVTTTQNSIVDVLYQLSTKNWEILKTTFSGLEDVIVNTTTSMAEMNDFLGLNIANSPSFMMKEGWASGSYFLVIGALLIPVLAAVTQLLNTKLMPQPAAGAGASDNPMANSMKTMTYMMPIMSAIFCFTLPTGLGLYWIAGAVVRSVQQLLINRHMDHVDVEDIIKKNQEKVAKKREKKGLPPQQISNSAKLNTRNIPEVASKRMSEEERQESVKKSTEYYSRNAKPGSMASRANMVKDFNEKNNR